MTELATIPNGLSVVVPVYGATASLPECITRADAAVIQLGLPAEIIVVDDGSESAVVVDVDTMTPLRCLVNPVNMGFGPTVNRGVAASRYDKVLLLNSDMFLEPEALRILVDELCEHDLAVSPHIALKSLDGPCESVSYVFLRRGRLNVGHLGMTEPALIPSSPCDIAYCCGGAMVTWRERFTELGGFAPLFVPYYWEDCDLGWRGWERGLSSRFIPAARAVHLHGATIRRGADDRIHAVREGNRILWALGDLDGVEAWTRLLLWAPVRAGADVLSGRLSVRVACTVVRKLGAVVRHRRFRRRMRPVNGSTSKAILDHFADLARQGEWGRR